MAETSCEPSFRLAPPHVRRSSHRHVILPAVGTKSALIRFDAAPCVCGSGQKVTNFDGYARLLLVLWIHFLQLLSLFFLIVFQSH
jgi:hypothetical protein